MDGLPTQAPPPLPGPYRSAPARDGLRPSPAVVSLVRGQVRALLDAAPAVHALSEPDRRRLAADLTKIASYAAECIRDDWYHAEQLGLRPLVRFRQTPPARALADGDWQPAAAGQIGRVTRETLNAIAFPTFVADLIRGTFSAIVQSTIQQMEAYTKLLEDVAKTVDQFMSDNISDNQARDWLAQRYPEYLRLDLSGDGPRLTIAPGADEQPPPAWNDDLALPESVGLEEDAIEERLVPAARRKLAQNRLQILATLVLMGINRIVVTGGKIRAAMEFHIDTSDRTQQQHATDFDLRVAAAGSFGFGPWSASVSTNIGYVSSSRSASSSEINTDTNLSSEVEIHFASDYFPLARVADGTTVDRIRANTPVPAANAPESIPWSQGSGPRPPVDRRPSSDALPPVPAMPGLTGGTRPPERPATPDQVFPVRREDRPAPSGTAPAARTGQAPPASTPASGNTTTATTPTAPSGPPRSAQPAAANPAH